MPKFTNCLTYFRLITNSFFARVFFRECLITSILRPEAYTPVVCWIINCRILNSGSCLYSSYSYSCRVLYWSINCRSKNCHVLNSGSCLYSGFSYSCWVPEFKCQSINNIYDVLNSSCQSCHSM